MDTKIEKNLWGAAIREAGHVALALQHDLVVGHIWIEAHGGGGSEIQDPSKKQLKDIDQLALCYAGGVAQKHFKAPTNCRAMREDCKRANKITEHQPVKERRATKRAGYERAQEIVVGNRDELRRLAEFIIPRRRIHISDVQPPIRLK